MLTPKEQKTLARLERNLKMATWKYILIYGFSFGLLASFFSAVIDVWAHNLPVTDIFKKKLWINLALAPVAGLFFGYILRSFSIKQYQKLKEKERLP